MVLRVHLMVLVVAAAAGGVFGTVAAEAMPLGGTPLAHIAGSSRKIKMYIKNTYLQLSLDGTVSGGMDDPSYYAVLQRSSVTAGQVKIQGVTSCMYLCMDTCGLPYAAKEYSDECIFNENIEAHNYNTYSSSKYSNARRTFYLGLNRKGLPRRVKTRGRRLGKLSVFTRVLTQPASADELMATSSSRCPSMVQIIAETGRCKRPRRRRRKRKRCREDEECEQNSAEGRRPLRRRMKPTQHKLRHRKHRNAEEHPDFDSLTEPVEDELDDFDYDVELFDVNGPE